MPCPCRAPSAACRSRGRPPTRATRWLPISARTARSSAGRCRRSAAVPSRAPVSWEGPRAVRDRPGRSRRSVIGEFSAAASDFVTRRPFLRAVDAAVIDRTTRLQRSLSRRALRRICPNGLGWSRCRPVCAARVCSSGREARRKPSRNFRLPFALSILCESSLARSGALHDAENDRTQLLSLRHRTETNRVRNVSEVRFPGTRLRGSMRIRLAPPLERASLHRGTIALGYESLAATLSCAQLQRKRRRFP